MPSLSIIIPVYNVEKYLSKCLDSILVDNSFTGQVMCVNDGSTDGSLAILEQYASKYPNIEVHSQSNAGLSVARNTGFDKATGDNVAILEGDDYWTSPNHIQMQLDYLEQHRECVLTTTPIFYNGNYDVDYYNSIAEFESIYTTKDFLRWNRIANMSACVIRNAVLKKNIFSNL